MCCVVYGDDHAANPLWLWRFGGEETGGGILRECVCLGWLYTPVVKWGFCAWLLVGKQRLRRRRRQCWRNKSISTMWNVHGYVSFSTWNTQYAKWKENDGGFEETWALRCHWWLGVENGALNQTCVCGYIIYSMCTYVGCWGVFVYVCPRRMAALCAVANQRMAAV